MICKIDGTGVILEKIVSVPIPLQIYLFFLTKPPKWPISFYVNYFSHFISSTCRVAGVIL